DPQLFRRFAALNIHDPATIADFARYYGPLFFDLKLKIRYRPHPYLEPIRVWQEQIWLMHLANTLWDMTQRNARKGLEYFISWKARPGGRNDAYFQPPSIWEVKSAAFASPCRIDLDSDGFEWANHLAVGDTILPAAVFVKKLIADQISDTMTPDLV